MKDGWRLAGAALIGAVVLADAAVAGSHSAYSPYLQQGLERANPGAPAPDPRRDYVAPRFIEPDKRSRTIAPPGIHQRHAPRLFPYDGDIRLREQKGDLPRVSMPRRWPWSVSAYR